MPRSLYQITRKSAPTAQNHLIPISDMPLLGTLTRLFKVVGTALALSPNSRGSAVCGMKQYRMPKQLQNGDSPNHQIDVERSNPQRHPLFPSQHDRERKFSRPSQAIAANGQTPRGTDKSIVCFFTNYLRCSMHRSLFIQTKVKDAILYGDSRLFASKPNFRTICSSQSNNWVAIFFQKSSEIRNTRILLCFSRLYSQIRQLCSYLLKMLQAAYLRASSGFFNAQIGEQD